MVCSVGVHYFCNTSPPEEVRGGSPPIVFVLLPDAEMLHNSRVSNLLHRRQQKEKRAAEEAVVAYQRQWQWPRSQRERNLDDPTRGVEMMLPGLTGEDPEWKSRQREQKDQLRRWLIQQQSEQRAQRRQEKLQGW